MLTARHQCVGRGQVGFPPVATAAIEVTKNGAVKKGVIYRKFAANNSYIYRTAGNPNGNLYLRT
jgi:hypothetical protein